MRVTRSSSGSCSAGATARTAKVPYSFKIPKRAGGNRGNIFLTGGNDFFSEEFFYEAFGGSTSLDDIKGYIKGLVRNDEIQAQLFLGAAYPGGGEGECRGCKGGGESRRPPRWVRSTRSWAASSGSRSW